jgi:hypothetical protein
MLTVVYSLQTCREIMMPCPVRGENRFGGTGRGWNMATIPGPLSMASQPRVAFMVRQDSRPKCAVSQTNIGWPTFFQNA